MNKLLGALVAVGCLLGLGACSNLPAGEPADDTPIYGSSTPR
jgi:hypothetical protein